MADLETRIDGSPGSIRAVGTWLRTDFGGGAESLATTVYQQRSVAASDWQGEAGAAFQTRAGALATAADDAQTTAGQIADHTDDIAQGLQDAHEAMAKVRTDATAGGLSVTGTVVHEPGPAPPEAGTLPADATPAESTAWESADQRVRDHNAQILVWNGCVTDANAAFTTWQDLLTNAASTWQTYDDKLVGLSADFLTAAAEIALISKAVPVLLGQADEYRTQAAQLRDHADALKRPDGSIVDRTRYYDLIDQADDLDGVRAPGAYHEAVKFELPKGIGRALGILGGAAAVYGVYSDVEDGESVPQAVVSNAAGFGASVVAGMYVGGLVGTAIPVPILGTVTGVVVGAVVGTVVGAITSGAIDGLWESGMDSVSDLGSAVTGGLDELKDTGAAIGDLAEGAWDAIF